MWKRTVTVLCIFLLLYPENASPLRAGEIVGGWAEVLGQELWDLAKNITNSAKIKDNYTSSNAQIEEKEPEKLLSSITDKIVKMLKQKMDAVRCILQAAEDAAEEYYYNETDTYFEYYSSKYSPVDNTEGDDDNFTLPDSIARNREMYKNMSITPDTHFYNIAVNTEYSAVHVPTNVYDRSEAAQSAIEWSENLDTTFEQNYKSDPALSWQYFCSSSGVMRHYPAMHWKQKIDQFDCRTRSWFIEAATCSKDVVILIDNSGSMYGFWNHIAKFTIGKIMDTLSNNDFLNILSYSDDVQALEPCFNETLVQATLENIQTFKTRLTQLKPEGYANLALAMVEAFKMLNESRIMKHCDEEGAGCNQAIMVVTDGVPDNVTQVFEEYNWFDNGTTIPVRIFTYLIGREISYVDEISWMACLNRGYFVHVGSLHEATEKVLKYIPVIARPLVLQAEEHPVSWTHAYITDNSFKDKTEGFENYRLLTSVAVPAYDRKMNRNNVTRTAELLGVAGTDVLIEDIKRLTTPYKIGVNGYPFIVSNNGYVLMHPNLKPLDGERLNKNYNSMDLTEVEFFDGDLEPRILHEQILQLREALVNASEGSMLNLPVKHFYDEMRRVYKETYDYYYKPLFGTPFSIGIALPKDYGDYWLKVGDEIRKHQHMKIDIIKNYFNGANWKIHPEWVYCKYHYTEGHEFASPELELIHFLKKITDDKTFTWPPEQYGEEPFSLDDVVDEEVECGDKTLDDDDFYCDEELMQRLVFDAKILEEAFMPLDLNYTLLEMYGATLKFIGTMSGLTRWEYIYGEGNDTEQDFGDIHSKSIDETWYKSAILQHNIESDSFVYSIPFKKDIHNQSITITGSHAIFPRDHGNEAPGCVVGFQFEHALLNNKFKDIVETNITDCEDCNAEWGKDMADSYVIDNHGYVVLSKEDKDIGQFFGELEGSVMEAMLRNKTFDKPFRVIGWILQWVFSKTMYLILEANLYPIWTDISVWANPFEDYVIDDDDDDVTTEKPMATTLPPKKKLRKGQNQEEEDYFEALKNRKPELVNISESCDTEANLFMLNQMKFIKRDEYHGVEKSECSKPFFVKRIPHSNLLLVHVLTNTQSCDIKMMASRRIITYDVDLPCQKLELNRLPRRKLSGCFNEHPLEEEIFNCGRTAGSSIVSNNIILNMILLYILKICIYRDCL